FILIWSSRSQTLMLGPSPRSNVTALVSSSSKCRTRGETKDVEWARVVGVGPGSFCGSQRKKPADLAPFDTETKCGLLGRGLPVAHRTYEWRSSCRRVLAGGGAGPAAPGGGGRLDPRGPAPC